MNRDPSIHGDKVCWPETTVKIQIKSVTFKNVWGKKILKGPEPLSATSIYIKIT